MPWWRSGWERDEQALERISKIVSERMRQTYPDSLRNMEKRPAERFFAIGLERELEADSRELVYDVLEDECLCPIYGRKRSITES